MKDVKRSAAGGVKVHLCFLLFEHVNIFFLGNLTILLNKTILLRHRYVKFTVSVTVEVVCTGLGDVQTVILIFHCPFIKCLCCCKTETAQSFFTLFFQGFYLLSLMDNVFVDM